MVFNDCEKHSDPDCKRSLLIALAHRIEAEGATNVVAAAASRTESQFMSDNEISTAAGADSQADTLPDEEDCLAMWDYHTRPEVVDAKLRLEEEERQAKIEARRSERETEDMQKEDELSLSLPARLAAYDQKMQETLQEYLDAERDEALALGDRVVFAAKVNETHDQVSSRMHALVANFSKRGFYIGATVDVTKRWLGGFNRGTWMNGHSSSFGSHSRMFVVAVRMGIQGGRLEKAMIQALQDTYPQNATTGPQIANQGAHCKGTLCGQFDVNFIYIVIF
jgi:hypothetical protein